jgi:hypothetical protein
MEKQMTVKWALTAAASVGLAVHLHWPQLKLDAITVGFLLLAFVPWLAPIVKSIEVQGLGKVELQDLKREVNRQSSDIQMIKAALKGIVTRFEIDYLRRLARAEPWNCQYDPDTYIRLKRLDDMGFVLPTLSIEGSRRLVRVQELFGDESIPVDKRKWFDMKAYVEITDDGRKYIALYDAVSEET